MWTWIIKNKWQILLIVIAFIAGYIANIYATRRSEKRIISAIMLQIDALNGRELSGNEKKHLDELRNRLKSLTEL